jgi:pyruvate formate lyase activating enzyme
MAEGERGYCGLRENRGGRMAVMAGGPRAGVVRWYYDPLPTNCVAMNVCGERCTAGRANLAVFYGACSLNCLFCQNWHYADDAAGLKPRASASELAEAVTDQVACVCYFGGDPTPQLPHALATSRWARELGSVRICWETNGTMHPMYLQRMADLCLESGGTIKFDLKAYSDPIHIALTGFADRRTLENFTSAARRAKERADVPLVVASTLLVPGYVDEEEVGGLARLIASVSPDIPYRLLAFFPSFLMDNLPATSRSHAESCLAAAREAGLRSVALGNVRLLGDAY